MSEDAWRTVDSVIKGIGASLISGLIMYYGYHTQLSLGEMADGRAEMAQRMEQVNATVQFVSNQKDLDVNLAMRMFEQLLSRYFQETGTRSVEEMHKRQMLLLRLIALNFQDVPINLKPLFEDLDSRLVANDDEAGRTALREIATEVARRQAFRMTFIKGVDSGRKVVGVGDEVKLKTIGLAAEIGEIGEQDAQVTLKHHDKRIGPFSVGYFDFPIIDNVKISENLRASVVLLASDGKKATVRLVAFQGDLAADRFDLKEMTRELTRREYGKS
jgi:hypothetical protein